MKQLFSFGKRLFGPWLFKQLVKPTIYAQFVAGEDTDEIKPVVSELRSHGIRPIFAYAAEDDIGYDTAPVCVCVCVCV